MVKLMKEVNHSPRQVNGTLVQRGQCVRSYSDIIEDLKWYIGKSPRRYTKWQIENATKWLRKEGMITTARTTRGVIITLSNYDFYQSASNYAYDYVDDHAPVQRTQSSATINKNVKNVKKKEKRKKLVFEDSHLELAKFL